MSARRLSLLAVGLLCLAGDPCWGETRVWVGDELGVNQDWYNQTHWNPVGYPDREDTLTVPWTGCDPIIQLRGVSWWEIGGGGSVTMTGLVTVGVDSKNTYLGNSHGPGALTVENGATVVIDHQPPDGGSHLTSDLYVGERADGSLTVDNAKLEALLTDITVGDFRTLVGGPFLGDVRVLNGGSIRNAKVVLAEAVGVTGRVRVDGYQSSALRSKWEAGTAFVVGNRGKGYLTVSDGGEVITKTLTLGQEATGYGEVTVLSDGTLNTWDATVGGKGAGVLTIANGGRVYADFAGVLLSIGDEAGSQGKVVVRDPGSKLTWWTSNRNETISVGHLGKGTLEARDGGVVQAGYVSIGSPLDPGTVLLSGTGSEIRYEESFSLLNGTLTVEQGGLLERTANTPVTDRVGGALAWMPGQAVVRGKNSKWANAYGGLEVSGGEGYGDLRIESGGDAGFKSLVIGKAAASDGYVCVTGAGSNLYGGTDLKVADAGKGVLEIKAGGRVGSSTSCIGAQTGSDGRVTIYGREGGKNSLWFITDSLYVGGTASASGGEAILAIVQWGRVEVFQSLKVWGHGLVTMDKKGLLTVAGTKVTLANGSQFYAEPGAKVEFTGTSLDIQSTHPPDLAGLADTTFVFAGGEDVTDTVEVAGWDGGRSWSAFGGNFALGRVQIGTPDVPAHIRLVNARPNTGDESTECLYVRHLEISRGSSLDLDGLTLYTLQVVNDGGTVLTGATGRVVEIGPIRRVGAGGLSAVYDTSGGDVIGPPLLTVSGLVDCLVESHLQDLTYPGAAVTFSATLAEERSEDGLAAGLFDHGFLDILDADFNVLASGVLEALELREPADGLGGLTGIAVMTVTESVLREGCSLGYGDTMEVELRLSGVNLADLGSNFSGGGEVALSPLPEPASLVLLAAGAALLFRRRRPAGAA